MDSTQGEDSVLPCFFDFTLQQMHVVVDHKVREPFPFCQLFKVRFVYQGRLHAQLDNFIEGFIVPF